MPIRFIEMVENIETIDPLHINITRDEVQDANLLFQKTFGFYGGYSQLSANAKDQVGESLILE